LSERFLIGGLFLALRSNSSCVEDLAFKKSECSSFVCFFNKMSNSSLALCTSGVVDSKFDVIPAVLVPVLGLLLVVLPWLRVRGKRLILLAPKEEKFAQNRKEEMAMLTSEMRTAAVLVAISALYETTVTALEMTGVNAGFDSGTLLTMLIGENDRVSMTLSVSRGVLGRRFAFFSTNFFPTAFFFLSCNYEPALWCWEWRY
jgi:hypothetical protein